MVKVQIQFGLAVSVLFFYTSNDAGAVIRERLGLQDPNGSYYDPAGEEIMLLSPSPFERYSFRHGAQAPVRHRSSDFAESGLIALALFTHDTHTRITLLPEKLSKESKHVVNKILM